MASSSASESGTPTAEQRQQGDHDANRHDHGEGASSSLPSTPTSGATAAPRPNCPAPSNAAAVPAASVMPGQRQRAGRVGDDEAHGRQNRPHRHHERGRARRHPQRRARRTSTPNSEDGDQRPHHDGRGREPPQQDHVELRRADQRHRPGSEDQRELLLIQAVAALQHERRARDVGEQTRHAERGDQHQDDEARVAEQFAVGGEDAAEPSAACGRTAAASPAAPATASSSSRPASTTSTANTQCHDAFNSTAAPSDGATTGATPRTSISRDITVAAAESANRSPTIGDGHHHRGGRAHALQAPRHAEHDDVRRERCTAARPACAARFPPSAGGGGPSESDSGPTISCPNARPANVPVQRQLRHRRRHRQLVGDTRATRADTCRSSAGPARPAAPAPRSSGSGSDAPAGASSTAGFGAP